VVQAKRGEEVEAWRRRGINGEGGILMGEGRE